MVGSLGQKRWNQSGLVNQIFDQSGERFKIWTNYKKLKQYIWTNYYKLKQFIAMKFGPINVTIAENYINKHVSLRGPSNIHFHREF